MARPYFLNPKWSDGGTITVSTSLSTSAGPANLQKRQPKDLWDNGGGSTGFIQVDAGSTKPFNLISMLFTNLTSGATYKAFSAPTSTSLSSGAASWESGVKTAWPTNNISTEWARRHTLLTLSTDQSNRWLRIEITNTGSTKIQVGRLAVGKAFQPAAPIRNFRLGHIDAGTQLPSLDGSVFTREAARRLKFVCLLEGLTEAEYYGSAYELYRLRGHTLDTLAVLDAGSTYNHHQMIYGLLSAREVAGIQAHVKRFNLRLELTELV